MNPSAVGPLSEAYTRALSRAAAMHPHKPALSEWAGLASDDQHFVTRPSWKQTRDRLRVLTIDTSATCNLTCPAMCYYHPALAGATARAPIEVFDRAICDAAQKLDLGVLAFTGKEPLVDAARTAAIANTANRIPDRRFSIGLVTNGTLVERQWSRLQPLVNTGALDFIDLSIDAGDAATHDMIRGKSGTFEAVQCALGRMLDNWPTVRIGVTSVLRGDNGGAIAAMVAKADRRLRYFFIFPFQPPLFEPAPPPPSWPVISTLLDELISLFEGPRRGAGLEVTVSLLGLYVAAAAEAGLLDLARLEEDENGQIFQRVEICGNQLVLVLQILPETGRHGLRILPSGQVLPGTHYLQSAAPDQFVIGNIVEESLTAIHQRGIGPGSAIDRLWQSRLGHSCRSRACWPVCFGGIAVSDNNILMGKGLDQPPELCLTTGAEIAGTLMGGESQ